MSVVDSVCLLTTPNTSPVISQLLRGRNIINNRTTVDEGVNTINAVETKTTTAQDQATKKKK